MILIDRFIPGEPKPQPRPRACIRGKHAGMYDIGTSDPWKRTIVTDLASYRPAKPWERPLRLDLTFYLPRPACRNLKKDPDGEIPHTARGDVDNYFKAVADCIVRAGFIADDGLIVSATIEKYYHAKNASPGVQLVLARWTPPEKPGMIHLEVGY